MGMSESDCLFCKMGAGGIPVEKTHEDDEVFAVTDLNPRAPLHMLIIPKAHIASARELTAEHGPLLARMVVVAKQLAMQHGVHDRGYRLTFNVGEEGGQTIFHLHMHLLGGRQMGAEG
jgi:histidine triad (HIT) family protein